MLSRGDLDAAANALLDLLIVSSDKRNKPFSSRDVDKFLKISKKIDIVNDIVLFQRFEGKATNLMGDTYETYGNEVLFRICCARYLFYVPARTTIPYFFR